MTAPQSPTTGWSAMRVYPYVAPLVLTPLAWLLWSRSAPSTTVAVIAWGVPILWAYIVPAVGTNVLRVWEFDVRLRLGRFRPHHGFVFGSATSMLAWLAHGAPARDLADALRYGLVLAGLLGFVNLLYEVKAIASGVLRVYNEPWARGAGPEAIAFDYAPWFFGGFGAMYGLGVGLAEWWTAAGGAGVWTGAGIFAATLALSIVVPVAGFIRRSVRIHGHWGTRPVRKRDAE